MPENVNHRNLRIPPQNLDAEMALLGSIMLRPEGLHDIVDFIKPDSFYSEKHRIIFETMLELFNKRSPIDLLSISNRLKEKGWLDQIGGNTYLTELVNIVPTSSNIHYYAEIVRARMLKNLLKFSVKNLKGSAFLGSGKIRI
jgi:replicative DNA helicase